MDILIAIVYVILFIILMVFVFSIGMLKPFMPKKEIALVLVVAFLIGSIGGAFFLEPLYEEVSVNLKRMFPEMKKHYIWICLPPQM